MKKILSAAVLLSAITLFSCKKDKDQQTFPYAGNWGGTYTSSMFISGTWDAVISTDGKFTGTASNPIDSSVTVEVLGTVNSAGVIDAEYKYATITASFDGQITGTQVTGTWSTDTLGISGTWVGAKK